jgi:hypothetical protein
VSGEANKTELPSCVDYGKLDYGYDAQFRVDVGVATAYVYQSGKLFSI